MIAADERPGPAALVWAAFVLGAASVLLVGFARVPFASMLNVTKPPWLALILRSVFGIAAPEELVKIAAIAAVAAICAASPPIPWMLWCMALRPGSVSRPMKTSLT